MGSLKEGALVAEYGNGRKKTKKDAQVTSANQYSGGDTINKFEGVTADDAFVEMTSAEIGTRRKKHKKKKDHDGLAGQSPSEDDLVAKKPHPATVMSGKKDYKENSNKWTQGNSSSNKESFTMSISENASIMQNYGQCGIIQGKRFSKEEDELIKDAICRYIKRKKLGENGLHMILHCQKYPQIKKGCWKEIAASIPWRLYTAVRKRAEKLLLTDWGHKWTPEEIEFVQNYVKENGKCWKSMADALGVFWQQVFYAWRRNRNSNFRLGRWSQDEYKQLFDLVHKDLQKKAFIEKNDRQGLLKENISWQTISDIMGTRVEDHIRLKWYRSLSSSMVHQGLWSDTDDYRLIDSLSKLDACCVEDVEWDTLLTNRSGDICCKRWMELTKHIGGSIERPFLEQVELLSTRYCIDMLEYREKALEKPS